MSSPATPSFDAIVAGTGPGGASVARELVRAGARVLMLEQGSAAPLTGTLGQMASMAAVPGKGAFLHRDLSLLVRALTAGGTSTINFATAAAPPAAMFAAHGIDLEPQLQAWRAELPMAPLPDALVGPMARRIAEAARGLSIDWRKLDKMIRPQACRSGCWRCVYGCPFGAKWTARELVDDARRDGAVLAERARVTRVLIEDGRAAGLEAMAGGRLQTFQAPLVVLAAGGIGSPRILHASGLMAETAAFFSDPVVAVMGSVDDLDGVGGAEVPMAAGASWHEDGIALADLTLPRPMYQAFAAQAAASTACSPMGARCPSWSRYGTRSAAASGRAGWTRRCSHPTARNSSVAWTSRAASWTRPAPIMYSRAIISRPIRAAACASGNTWAATCRHRRRACTCAMPR
jgi:hypothetical protein